MKQLSALVALAGALFGCYGPIKSTRDILDAEVQIQAAKSAGADEKAIYEWTAANHYLRKAREEVAYSDYQAGVDFAEKASLCAHAALLTSLNENPAAAEEARRQCHPDAEYRKRAATNTGGATP